MKNSTPGCWTCSIPRCGMVCFLYGPVSRRGGYAIAVDQDVAGNGSAKASPLPREEIIQNGTAVENESGSGFSLKNFFGVWEEVFHKQTLRECNRKVIVMYYKTHDFISIGLHTTYINHCSAVVISHMDIRDDA